MGFVIDDQIEMEGREFLAVTPIHHQRLDRGDNNAGT
jgi:hypothetical protein